MTLFFDRKIFSIFFSVDFFSVIFFSMKLFCSPISIPKFPKIPKITLRKLCDEAGALREALRWYSRTFWKKRLSFALYAISDPPTWWIHCTVGAGVKSVGAGVDTRSPTLPCLRVVFPVLRFQSPEPFCSVCCYKGLFEKVGTSWVTIFVRIINSYWNYKRKWWIEQ